MIATRDRLAKCSCTALVVTLGVWASGGSTAAAPPLAKPPLPGMLDSATVNLLKTDGVIEFEPVGRRFVGNIIDHLVQHAPLLENDILRDLGVQIESEAYFEVITSTAPLATVCIEQVCLGDRFRSIFRDPDASLEQAILTKLIVQSLHTLGRARDEYAEYTGGAISQLLPPKGHFVAILPTAEMPEEMLAEYLPRYNQEIVRRAYSVRGGLGRIEFRNSTDRVIRFLQSFIDNLEADSRASLLHELSALDEYYEHGQSIQDVLGKAKETVVPQVP